MEEVEKLLKYSVEEMERLLSAKTVVGEPLTVDGNTVVPLLSVGFGFGAGGVVRCREYVSHGFPLALHDFGNQY